MALEGESAPTDVLLAEEAFGDIREMSLEDNCRDYHLQRGQVIGRRVMLFSSLALALTAVMAVLGLRSIWSSESDAPLQADEEASTDLLQVIHKDGKNWFTDCGNTYELEKVTHSNLGGFGPDAGAQDIVWVAKHMYRGEFLGYIDIVLIAKTPYSPWSDLSLNGMHGKFGRVALPAGQKLEAELTFLDHETKKPITLPEITMTFYDIDQGPEGSATEFVRVITPHKTMLHKDADIRVVEMPDGSVEYTATHEGNKEDNPLEPDALSTLMKERALAFTLDNSTKVDFDFGSSQGAFVRGFFFAFMNAINCHLVEITSTTTTTTTTTTTIYHPFPWWIVGVIAAILLLILLLLLLCWIFRTFYRKLTFTERKTMVKNRFIRQVNRAAEILGGPNPNYNDPELKSILQKLNDNKQHVKALCGNQWVEWKAPGQCQVCRTDVDRKEKGLQCASGGHRICWNCMCHNMDWDAICEDELTHLKDDTDIYIWDCNQ
mmetsp:Transcript_40821/g.87654  ORF Transcript_40821/g.87654 Transcript_40821/m.87654 type:complete len:490 (+) Transcript_40821:69-1538(+)